MITKPSDTASRGQSDPMDVDAVNSLSDNNSASSFSRGSFDLGAICSPKRFEWANMNLDTGACSEHMSINIGPDGAGDGRFRGECVPDGGAWQFQRYDENCLLKSLSGRVTGAHKVLRNRVQRTTRFPSGIRRWFRDSSAQHKWPKNEGPLREIGELVRKKTAHSGLHRRQQLQFFA